MTPPRRHQYRTLVTSNDRLCRDHFKLVLELAEFPPTEPGQFVQVACRELDLDYSCSRDVEWVDGEGVEVRHPELITPLALCRPFSLAGRRNSLSGVELILIHRVVGVGTEWMSKLRPGDAVHILGPLGNRFSLPNEDQTALLVAGGVGIPPMLYLAETLARRAAIAMCGALSRDLLPLTLRGNASQSLSSPEPALQAEEFSKYGIPSIITTDDGTYGYRGYVTQALEAYLQKHSGDPSRFIIYTCGPEPMMMRVADIAVRAGIECQVAVERAMACGMGTCQSCVIRVRQPTAAQSDWVYRLACTDGPIFDASQLLW